ncbi:MAG: hypothetical protein ACW967_09580 [Candidatus Hodarchaeales archaeon]|jgi:hypothetical protein
MDVKLFKEPVEISEVSLIDIWGEETGSLIKKSIETYYKGKKIKSDGNQVLFFSIYRTEEGLVHPAYVTPFLISFKTKKRSYSTKNYAVLRFFEKNKEDNEEFFDRAKYHLHRMKTLKQLGKFYPPFLIHDSSIANGFLIFQKFYYYPICKFNSNESISEFFDLIYYSSTKRIFLDYNQNHFLWNDKKKHLIYTDADFIEELPFNKAVVENFNQATIYLTSENANSFAIALKSFKKSKKKYSSDFYRILLEQIKEKLQSLKAREQNPIIKNRIKAYNHILKENSK